jgi:hypothetical protein
MTGISLEGRDGCAAEGDIQKEYGSRMVRGWFEDGLDVSIFAVNPNNAVYCTALLKKASESEWQQDLGCGFHLQPKRRLRHLEAAKQTRLATLGNRRLDEGQGNLIIKWLHGAGKVKNIRELQSEFGREIGVKYGGVRGGIWSCVCSSSSSRSLVKPSPLIFSVALSQEVSAGRHSFSDPPSLYTDVWMCNFLMDAEAYGYTAYK